MANGANSIAIKKFSISLLSRLFKISPSQWPRVTECWLITFFFKVGSAVGWTIVTAAFVAKFGIAFLPALFIVNAILIMFSTFIFERFIMRIKREVLMILMILIGAICLFFASFLYDKSPIMFFLLVVVAESVFLAQFNVFIPILVGDRFTPLESQTTFPFIESAETIGGIIGGILVALLASTVHVGWFMYVWIAFLSCVIVIFIITSYMRTLPPLPFRVNASPREKMTDQIKQVFLGIKQFPFLKGLIMIVLLQWVFMNVLEFQYTKAIEQSITGTREATVALKMNATQMQAAVLTPETAMTQTVNTNLPSPQAAQQTASMTTQEQKAFTQKLGAWKGLFHTGALVAQVLLASRLITSLGVVGSLLLHPIIMLMSLIGMFLKFGFASAVVSKMSFDVTNVVHKNAYFSSQYALPKNIRDQAAEFLEGMVRPMGTIVGMLFLLFFQIFFAGKDLSMWIHITMFVIMAAVLIATIKLQPKYTQISKEQLFSNLPYPDKINAIEILTQRGHKNSPQILVDKLNEALAEPKNAGVLESPFVRIKLLNALGQFHDYRTLPDILDALADPDSEVRLEAAHALMNFYDIGDKFYSQAFSRYRMIEILKDIFKKEKSSSVRGAIIRVFSLLKQSDIVPFLLEVLKENENEARADCVFTIGLFHDPYAAYYILPHLSDENPRVRASAIAALWQFSKYRARLEVLLNEMLESSVPEVLRAGMFALGEIGLPKKRILLDAINHGDSDMQLEAAFSLTKMGDPTGFQILLGKLLSFSPEQFESLRRFFYRLKPKARRMVEHVLVAAISDKLNKIMREKGEQSLEEIDVDILEKLRRLYKLLDQHEELFAIESALAEKLKTV